MDLPIRPKTPQELKDSCKHFDLASRGKWLAHIDALVCPDCHTTISGLDINREQQRKIKIHGDVA